MKLCKVIDSTREERYMDNGHYINREEKEVEITFKDVTVENFPNQREEVIIDVYETERTPKFQNAK